MSQTREQLIARAKLIQQAREVQAQRAQKASAAAPEQTMLEAGVDNASALAQGVGSGATMGYAPQINAAIEPLVTKVADVVQGTDNYKDLPDYTTRRDQFAGLQEALKQRHPISYGAGQLGGGIAGAVALPSMALGKAGLGLKTLASVGTGAAMRGVQNPGDVKGEVNPLQLEERAQMAMDPVGVGIDAVLPGASSGMRSVAESRAFKALGPYARDVMKTKTPEKIKEIGRTVLDSDAFGWLPKSYEALQKRLQGRQLAAGKELGDSVLDMSTKQTGTPVSISRTDVINNLEKELVSPNIDIAGVPERNAKMLDYMDQFKREGKPDNFIGPINDNIPLMDAELKKRAVGKEINWDRLPNADIPEQEIFNRALNSELREGVEKGGETLAQNTGYDIGKFKKMKSEYANLSTAEDVLRRRSQKEFANRMTSPSDYGVGLVGAGVGMMSGGSLEDKIKNGLAGASLGLANRGARNYGNQITARVLDRGSKLLSNPQAAQSLWATILRLKEEKKQNGK